MTDKRADDYLFLGIVLLLAFCLLVLLVRPAGAGRCLTKGEAQHVYPGKWLYWHGKNRCWDATPGRNIIHYRRRPVSPLIVPAPIIEDEPTIQDAPSFMPWDARIGIPFGKPQETYQ